MAGPDLRLFERLLSLASSERRPEEDFFTEVVAALLRHDPGLFWSWLKPGPKWSPFDASKDVVEVRTQVWRRQLEDHETHSRIDLVFTRTRGDRRDVAYVESKVASGEGEDQLRRYTDHLLREGAPHPLLVYVTRDFDPKGHPDSSAFDWKPVRWLDFYACLDPASPSSLVQEARAFMQHLRMDQSRILTPLDLTVANELPGVWSKLAEVLTRVENSTRYRTLSRQAKAVGPQLGRLVSHKRLMLIQLSTGALWGRQATDGLWLAVGFRMDREDRVPSASVFVETPRELSLERQNEVEAQFDAFLQTHAAAGGEGWGVYGERPFRYLERQRSLAAFLGAEDAIEGVTQFFETCLSELARPLDRDQPRVAPPEPEGLGA